MRSFLNMEHPVINNNKPLLEVKGLKTYFYTEDGVVRAVDGVSFEVYPGEVLGLVGESGCGKSVTSLSIMRLISKPGRIDEGEILLDGENLLKLPENEMIKVRGNRISMIFQQPQTALNPVFKVGDQLAEVLDVHQDLGKEAGWKRAVALLKMVGVALACVPELLIADEPTTALDVTIQAQILDLMRDLRREMGTSVILITHDLGVVAEMAERVAVMYAGEIVEQTDVNTLFDQPLHPYTQGLIGSIPILGEIKEKLEVIPGSVPNLVNLPPGCRFAPRCQARFKYGCTVCAEVKPELVEVKQGHQVRCWLYQSAEEYNHVAPLKVS
jgi:oligopeptide/dipeptide ABC transporter ATP-binding protein